MKVAIATDWFPPRAGGIESQLATLAERLAARGHQVTVITSTPGAKSGAGYVVHRIEGPRVPLTDVCIAPGLSAVLRAAVADRFELVHAHVSVVSPVGYLSALAASSQGVPTVVTFHSVLRAKRLLLAAYNAIARLDARPIVWSAVSSLVARQVGAALGGAVTVLPNGLELAWWRDTPRAASAGSRPVTFVTAMRLHRKKRPRQLVAAFADAVRRAGMPARLVLAGAGPEAEALRRDIASMAPANIDLVGWQDGPALRGLYAAADAFVLPTRREAFGIAALEARAAGLPVIASTRAGCRDFLRHDQNAMLCDSDAEFASAMARFVREPALRLRLAAAEDSLERYDWDAVVRKHECLYERARDAASAGFATAAARA
jgi:glycosyltransferase involved in cell wall biosynthesis